MFFDVAERVLTKWKMERRIVQRRQLINLGDSLFRIAQRRKIRAAGVCKKLPDYHTGECGFVVCRMGRADRCFAENARLESSGFDERDLKVI